jgi:hypothetical protein
LAASSASVGGDVGAVVWRACGDSVVMGERYAERCGNAMGVVLSASKPRGLDVGVLHHGFLLFWAGIFDSLRLLPSWRVFIVRLVGSSELSFGGLVLWIRLFVRVFFFVGLLFVGWIESSSFRWVELELDSLGWVRFFGGASW